MLGLTPDLTCFFTREQEKSKQDSKKDKQFDKEIAYSRMNVKLWHMNIAK